MFKWLKNEINLQVLIKQIILQIIFSPKFSLYYQDHSFYSSEQSSKDSQDASNTTRILLSLLTSFFGADS